MILCYIYEQMADFEITLLLHRLRNTGRRKIIAVADHNSLLTAQSGLQYQPDKTIDEVTDVSAVAALIIPGGPINEGQTQINRLIKQMIEKQKLVAAICFAPQFLGRAGVLDSYQFTTSCSAEKIKQLGCLDPFYWAHYQEQRVVVDRNLITAKGYAFVDFTAAVADYLDVFQDEEQKYNQLGKIKESEN